VNQTFRYYISDREWPWTKIVADLSFITIWTAAIVGGLVSSPPVDQQTYIAATVFLLASEVFLMLRLKRDYINSILRPANETVTVDLSQIVYHTYNKNSEAITMTFASGITMTKVILLLGDPTPRWLLKGEGLQFEIRESIERFQELKAILVQNGVKIQ